MHRSFRAATVVVALLALGAFAPTAFASAVTATASSSKITLRGGHVLRVSLRPPDSGSTGYHWNVSTPAPRPLLRRTSDRTSHGSQVFTFRAGRAGVTVLHFRYVPPGRGAKPVNRLDLRVVVDPPAQRLRCDPPHSRTVLSTRRARIFSVRRSVVVALHGVHVFHYNALYGCDFHRQRAHPIANLGSNHSDNASANRLGAVKLKGRIAGFVLYKGCRFAVLGDGACIEPYPPALVSQDLGTGRVIRRVFTKGFPAHPVIRFVMSGRGGLAWMEYEGNNVNSVHRSDHPIVGGNAIATDNQVLDDGRHGYVDDDSLYGIRDGFRWKSAGVVKKASLF
jgi:hypothetical protein